MEDHKTSWFGRRIQVWYDLRVISIVLVAVGLLFVLNGVHFLARGFVGTVGNQPQQFKTEVPGEFYNAAAARAATSGGLVLLGLAVICWFVDNRIYKSLQKRRQTDLGTED